MITIHSRTRNCDRVIGDMKTAAMRACDEKQSCVHHHVQLVWMGNGHVDEQKRGADEVIYIYIYWTTLMSIGDVGVRTRESAMRYTRLNLKL